MNNLQKHYDEKWNKLSKVSELIDGGLWSYSVTLTHQKYGKCYLLIEYDRGKPCYGIYYGCQMPVEIEQKYSQDLDSLKKEIWESYKKEIYPITTNVKMDNVFLPDCEPDCRYSKNVFWLFWIRLDEHLTMDDAMKRLYALIKIFKEKGFTK